MDDKERKRTSAGYRVMLAVTLLAALTILASTLIFSHTAKQASDEVTTALGAFYLEEITDRTVFEISTQLESHILRLERTAAELNAERLASEESLREYLALVQRLNGLDICAVVDEQGMVYTADSTFSGISRFAFLSEPLTQTQLFTARSGGSRAMVLIAAPTQRLPFGETSIVACLTGLDVDKMISAQQLQGINNQVLCRLFDGDTGTCLVESEGRYADGSSIFDVWNNLCEFSGEYSSQRLMDDWQNRREGYAYYTAPEGSTELYYKPVPGTPWMVSVRLRQNVIGMQVTASRNKILQSSRIQLTAVILSMLAVLFCAVAQVRKSQRERFQREQNEEMLRQASVLQVLCREYSSVYYVDLDRDSIVPVRYTEGARSFDLQTNQSYSFRTLYERYVRACVAPEEAAEMLQYADAAYLRRALRDSEMLTHLYRVHRDGQEVYVQLRIARVESGEQIRHVVMGYAMVDDEVRAEQEKQRALKEALAQAEQANRAKTAFLNNMSHDIRTPMNAIIGFTNIARKQEAGPEIRSCLEKISESSEHLLTLINDVLDISRIESGNVQLNLVPVDITGVVDVALDIMRGYLTERSIAFHVLRAKPQNPFVMADPVRIREILVNILGNAAKFTADGGTITFEATSRPGADEEHMIARYRISDTGVGMSEVFVQHVFDEFAQEESNARTQYKGTGLGMAITRHYVEMMGGSITVESRKGVGSTFTVELPLLLVEPDCVPMRTVSGDETNISGVSVLMAEDNDLNAEIAAVQLEDNGMHVTRAVNGREAVELFAREAPGTFDVILMDIMMPEMNGYDATRAIRAMAQRPDAQVIPIIAMTANAFAEDVRASMAAGMNGHLSKPIKIEEVLTTIANTLQG